MSGNNIKKKFKIISKEKDISLITINRDNIELLRLWKNYHRQFFFYNKIITKEEQIKWYEKFKKRDLDYIFIVEYLDEKIGCMGARLIDNTFDIYNIILGEKKYEKKGLMSKSFNLMISFLMDSFDYDITIKALLSNNNAINWYKKHCFLEINRIDNYTMLKLDKNNFLKEKYKIIYY
jgi:hypothetical protein